MVDWRVVSFVLFSLCLYLLLSSSSCGSPPLHDNVREETWRYPERASESDVDTIYSQCGSLIPPKAGWWPQQRPEGMKRVQRLPLIPLGSRQQLGCLAELYELKTGAELGNLSPFHCTRHLTTRTARIAHDTPLRLRA
jgi:hypothetical protein